MHLLCARYKMRLVQNVAILKHKMWFSCDPTDTSHCWRQAAGDESTVQVRSVQRAVDHLVYFTGLRMG